MVKQQKLSTLLIELVINIVVPTLILKKLSAPEQLGAHMALLLALSLPLGYGLFQFFSERKFGLIPVLSFLGILLTGSIGLLELDAKYIAIKEAAIPLFIGVATVFSLKTPYPLVKTFLYNDLILQTKKIEAALQSHQNTHRFERSLVNATYMLSGSFLLSAILNYLLAKWVVTSPSGTAAFNEQLGTMNLLSYPVIVLPCMLVTLAALMYLFKQIEKLTHLSFEEILNQ